MSKIKSSIGTRIACAFAFSAAALVVPGVPYAKPVPGAPMSPTVCKAIDGVWSLPYTCTIPGGTAAIVASPFKIGDGVTLDVRGTLTINRGVTVANNGVITIANSGTVVPNDWEAGIVVVGRLENAGTITIQNAYYGTDNDFSEGTEGIFVATSIDPLSSGPAPFAVFPGNLTNSGLIVIQNSGHQTRGMKIDGAVVNSGTITVANTLSDSVGIYNRRDDSQGGTYKLNGTLTNAGTMTIANNGDASGNGMYNQGLFTITATGNITIEPTESAATGIWNGGAITSFGTFANNRGAFNAGEPELSYWGVFNEGTMVNYGTTTVSPVGIFFNGRVMVNLGMITSYGIMADGSYGQTMINYGTIYNYGMIPGGENKGFCVDEPGGTGC